MTSVEANLLRGYVRRSLRSCNAEIPGVGPPDVVTIYRTYQEISHYQNQFPALTWTCENMLAPSEFSLEPPIIYPHIPRLYQPINLILPEAGISWNKRWSCIQEEEETSWCPEVSESGGERVQQGKLSADIPQITELPPSLLYQARTS
jgi:hypothetical protein